MTPAGTLPSTPFSARNFSASPTSLRLATSVLILFKVVDGDWSPSIAILWEKFPKSSATPLAYDSGCFNFRILTTSLTSDSILSFSFWNSICSLLTVSINSLILVSSSLRLISLESWRDRLPSDSWTISKNFLLSSRLNLE